MSLNQSNLILAYLNRKTDMPGDTERESLAVQEILAHCYDALFHWSGMHGVIIRTNISDEVAQPRLNAFNVLCNWYKAFDRPVFSTGYPQLGAYVRR